MKQKVGVVGAGASGMMAAVFAARAGADVLLLEGKEKIGKKLLATGNGKCNFTNRQMSPDFFRSETPKQVERALSHFSLEDTLSYMESIGIVPFDKNGYYYPASGQAASVVSAFELELARLKVKVLCETQVLAVKKNKHGFLIETQNKSYEVDRLILACGSKAGISSANAMDGYALAKQLGHRLTVMVPALTGLCAQGNWKEWSGVRMQGEVSIFENGKKVSSDRGELQLTEYGISGIPVFQVSRFASMALYKKQNVTAVLDFFPELSEQELVTLLAFRKKNLKGRNNKELLIGLIPQKMISVFLKRAAYGKELANLMKNFSLTIIRSNPLANAQVCAGGVSMAQIDPDTMQSKICPGLFFTGEMLDADGICGGYNLQWAWATGAVAGRNAAK